MASSELTVAVEPTAFVKWMGRHPFIAVAIYPVWRFFPARWLVKVRA